MFHKYEMNLLIKFNHYTFFFQEIVDFSRMSQMPKKSCTGEKNVLQTPCCIEFSEVPTSVTSTEGFQQFMSFRSTL